MAAWLLAGCGGEPPPAEAPASTSQAPAVLVVSQTRHFEIASTADAALTARAADAAEALYDAYAMFFGEALPPAGAKFRLRLYATRAEFQANNRSRPWAEAYYHRGMSHAYLDGDKPNPFHWPLVVRLPAGQNENRINERDGGFPYHAGPLT